MSEPRHADCCKYCAHRATDFIFRDAVLCGLRGQGEKYVLFTEVCDSFERKEKQ